MNLKLTICSWILFIIMSSSDAEKCICRLPEIQQLRAEKMIKEKTYNGPIIDVFNPLHPYQICTKILNDENAFWVFGPDAEICSSNITCAITDSHKKVTLTEIPKTGVECVRKGINPKLLACYNNECTTVADEANIFITNSTLRDLLRGKVPR